MIGYAPACLCRELTYAFGPSGRRSASTNKDSCRGTTSPLRGMGSFAGQKVVHPRWPAGRPLPRDRIKICCEGKMVPLPVVASPNEMLAGAQVGVRPPARHNCSVYGSWRDQLEAGFGQGFRSVRGARLFVKWSFCEQCATSAAAVCARSNQRARPLSTLA